MAPDMRLLFMLAGLLTAALPGRPPPAPLGQPDTNSTHSKPLEPREPTHFSSVSLWRSRPRLVNGSSRCSGVVEIQLNSTWKPVCGSPPWDSRAAEAVCRVLDCGEPVPPTQELLWGSAGGNASRAPNTSLPAVRCNSSEWQLCEVVNRPCSTEGKPVQVTCAENRVLRLVDGGSPCAGRVEMQEHGRWGTVCDDTWDLEDAHVVCRQLGCGWAIQALPGLHFSPGQGPIHRDQVNCSGNEDYLWDCPGMPGAHYCGHKEDAGVVCAEHQSWRLSGGADRCEGQVEVHFRGVWSTVCDSEWYSQEAGVLCQALGCGTVVDRPKGRPHSLAGRMYYSCKGWEPTLSDCSWRFNNSNLCSQSHAARVLCSGSRSLNNLSTSEAPASVQPASTEPSVIVKVDDKESRELALLIPCIILGILLLASLISIACILLRIKGKYALPVTMNHQYLPTTIPAGTNSYQAVPITIPKEEVPKLSIQVRAQPAEDSSSSSDSDYEHYDFSTQPPVALSTFYNSQRHRVTDDEVQQRRFQMPPLEEGLEELHVPISAANPGHSMASTPSLGPQSQHRSQSESSTSSGEDYCNSPSSKPQLPWSSQGFPSERNSLLEQPPNLELASPQVTCSGFPAEDSSSTSSGEWYQNFQPPPQLPSVEQFGCPGNGAGPPASRPDSTDEDDYDDIGAA
ncbi:T-cell differentiation antigen CD6 isoform X2 [Ochotona curzoniae]|uniref:T-cell differentiation antigen CD6 isoform X2 n=1 Tax=Ochotona curzoniae TaxID=130825 RepID=UPI001B352DD4|nr:T-cell differentiation antigen CD6 isoform X2 [Ochotona curzoniae]